MNRPVELLLVRHGETEWNAVGRLQGQLDSPLSTRGEAQARALRQRLATENIARVVSSDLLRARLTAKLIVDEGPSLRFGIELEPRLRERHFGVLQGKVIEELAAEDRVHYDRSKNDEFYEVPGGESRAAVLQRAMTGLQSVAVSSQAGERVLVVSHGGVLNVVLRHLSGTPLIGDRGFTVGNCSLSRVIYDGGRFSVTALDSGRDALSATLDGQG